MNLLALDLSLSSTGYVVLLNNKIVEYNRIVSENKEITQKSKKLNQYYYFSSSTDENKRLYQLVITIKYLIKKYKITDIIIEDQYIGCNPKVGMTLSKIKGAISYISTLYGCNFHTISPTQVRKIIIDKGKVTKEEIANYIRNNYLDCGEFSDKQGKDKTSDIYDATAVLLAFCRLNNIEVKYENIL